MQANYVQRLRLKRAALALLCLLASALLSACRLPDRRSPTSAIAPGVSTPRKPTPTLLSATLTPPASPIPPDSGWSPLHAGMETRVLNVVASDGEWLESMTLLRLDPTQFRFDVAYHPGEPQGLLAWQTQTNALLVINGGFFTEANKATGLVISGGQTFGASYERFGGMFAVTDTGPELRWLPQQPYDPAEALQGALQSFPMLLRPGAVPGPTEDDGHRARRTVVALDQQGRIVFLVAAHGHFTLYGLSHFLADSDLALDTALNLDGGASSGLLLAEPHLHIPAFALLPTVITIHER